LAEQLISKKDLALYAEILHGLQLSLLM